MNQVLHSLGRHVEHDPRSRGYSVVVDHNQPLRKVTHRRYGSILNQGQLGSCTGNAMAGAVNTAPIHKPGAKPLVEADAVSIYEAATLVDNVPGVYPPDDTGSSGLAVCKVAKSRGLISAYHHAFSLSDALQALMAGPVIVGMDWYEGFDTPDTNAVVTIQGQVRGGHEVEAVGYDPATRLVKFANSWGKTYGKAGYFFMLDGTLGQLLNQQGDVQVPLP
jgi:Papain family cysteine protease